MRRIDRTSSECALPTAGEARLGNPDNVDEELLHRLLREGESARLDYNRRIPLCTWYIGEKAELLKDILAFANAWREQDAYILTGVKHSPGEPAAIIGLDSPLDDAQVQQFVNSKTNRPIHFGYVEFASSRGNIGVFQIPVQQRPFYLRERFGALKANVIYVRRGSSTDIASPDEVAAMERRQHTQWAAPRLSFEFADRQSLAAAASFYILNESYTNPFQTKRCPASGSRAAAWSVRSCGTSTQRFIEMCRTTS